MIELSGDGYTAKVDPLGARLAGLNASGTALLIGDDRAPSAFSGAVLVPWSNRIRDGRYDFDGEQHQLPISEPARNNALHGLVLKQTWQAAQVSTDAVTLALRLEPSPGYPFPLDLQIRYAVHDSGLTAQLDATNLGDRPAPYGCGFHPYLLPHKGSVDQVMLTLGATERMISDPQRLLPIGRAPVAGTPYDFASGAEIGTLHLDDAFTGLAGDAGGHSLTVDAVKAWWDASMPWVQVFTATDRSALAVEPCTSPPDAFRSGHDLVVLAPGAVHSVRWGIGKLPDAEL